MKQSARLQPVCDFSKKREEDAAKQLAKISRELATHKKRLSDLESYRDEYSKQFTTAGGKGLSATRIRDYHGFMANLSKVLEQQKSTISVLECDFEEKKRQWLAARSRSKALDAVQGRYQQQEITADEKKLQKEIDDRAIRPAKN